MRGNKSSLAGISKQKYKLPPGLDKTSCYLGAVIDRKWVVATVVKERIQRFLISKIIER